MLMANALFYFLHKSQAEEKILKDENTQIFHYLQTSLTKTNLSGLI